MRIVPVALAGALLLLAAPLDAQDVTQPEGWDARKAQVTRADLEELLDRLEQTAGSNAYSGTLRDQARDQARLIRARLVEGDFQVGDRILLFVEEEEALSDTFAVQPGGIINLPQIGAVSLAGVLRAELESHLGTALTKYLREPTIQARALIRLTISGSVDSPGFYMVSAEDLLTDALMLAGGPSANADVTEIRIDRGDRRIWEGEPLQQAIIQGQTIDQLNLRSGDMIQVPDEGRGIGGFETTLRTVGLLIAIPITIIGLVTLLN